ncbi:MAG: stage II sporulation protein M [Proteobacteria bacterium]|nr:stage II sporulation protein M [Pseudomonadota bacterium]
MSEDRDTFVASRRPRWLKLERRLVTTRTAEQWSELSSLYRAICADLARARTRNLPPDIQSYLDELAGRAHNRLYGVRRGGGLGLLEVVGREFPREVRRCWRFFLAANLLFYGPFIVGFVGSMANPGFASSVLPEAMLSQLEQSYSSADMARGSSFDAAMAGFYVWNNVGIAFRCFATGALAGLGSVFFLVYNGLTIGTVAGYLGSVGYGMNLLSFTSGHTAWELTGVVVAGTAGLRLGWAMVVTEGRTRVGSLRHSAPALYNLIVGSATLLLVAAAIEGFWSAGPVPLSGKLVFGAIQVLIVAAWLILGGRRAT